MRKLLKIRKENVKIILKEFEGMVDELRRYVEKTLKNSQIPTFCECFKHFTEFSEQFGKNFLKFSGKFLEILWEIVRKVWNYYKKLIIEEETMNNFKWIF